MAWNLAGQLIESCSCNMLCPCWFGVPELMQMDQGWCASPLLFRIREGSAGDVDLGGHTVVVSTHFPGPTMFDGGGTARVIIDDGVDDAQREQLESIFQGRAGGPMEIIGSLVAAWLPTRSAAIEVTENDGDVSATVAGFGEIRSQRMKDDGGRATLLQNAGFTAALQFDGNAGEMAPSDSRWADAEMPQAEFRTKSGVVGNWTWAG